MNWWGQQIIDKTEEVFHAAYYNSEWYKMPPEMRRYILLIQNNSTKRKTLTAGKMGEVSLEAAAIVIFKIFVKNDLEVSSNYESFIAAIEIFSFLYADCKDFSGK